MGVEHLLDQLALDRAPGIAAAHGDDAHRAARDRVAKAAVDEVHPPRILRPG